MSPRENQCRPRRSRGWHSFSRGDNFPCYPLVQSIIIIYITIIILNVDLLHRLLYVWFQNNSGQVNIWSCISYSENSNLIRRKSESMVNRKRINSAHRCFLEYHPSTSNITSCQVPSRVRAWFHDSASDIDFYQMSLSQSESTILHESIILFYVTWVTHVTYCYCSASVVVR